MLAIRLSSLDILHAAPTFLPSQLTWAHLANSLLGPRWVEACFRPYWLGSGQVWSLCDRLAWREARSALQVAL